MEFYQLALLLHAHYVTSQRMNVGHANRTPLTPFMEVPGTCATAGGGQGSYEEVWGITKEECALDCYGWVECVGFEFSALKSSQLYYKCEKHKELITHSLPVKSTECYIRDEPAMLAAFKGARGKFASRLDPPPSPLSPPPLALPPPGPAALWRAGPSRTCGGFASASGAAELTPAAGPDLSDCDLRGAMGASFVGSNLEFTSWRAAELIGADLS
ncbi:hypothetical protein EMIHUDRAFT_452443, partial [Emiliania huxleyi CCMP1516]|uniref:Apple domain-containing protein n=2 Tax=Emiliania huxleyi TaxID=2903 RepID=A0A0D3IJC2_EMIH1